MLLSLFILASAVISGCLSAHTTGHHGHHHTTTVHHGHQATVHHGHHHQSTTPHEPDENENVSFKYDHSAQVMLALKKHICYIYSMNQDQMNSVHTLIGLRTLEINLIQMIDSNPATVPMSYLDLRDSSHSLYNTCKGKIILQLNF